MFRIALPELVGQQIILPRLTKFQSEQPKLRLEISTNVVPVEFHRREADIVVRFIRPESGRYKIQRIGRSGFGLYCSPQYIANSPLPITEENLISHRLIGWDRNLRYVFLAQWMHELVNGSTPALSFDGLQSQLLTAQAGHGIALLPDFVSGISDLVQVLPDIRFEQDIWLMRHRDTEDSYYSEAICLTIKEAILSH